MSTEDTGKIIAGVINPELQSKILSLHYGDHLSFSAISRVLGINRKTVAKVVNRRSVKLSKSEVKRSSIIDPHKEAIEALLKADAAMPSTVILQHLRKEGYLGGYSAVKEWVAKNRPQSAVRAREAFLRLQFFPGETAQMDWGEFGDVFGSGVKVHCFLMVLCYSRLLYVEFTRSEKLEDFIRCHENAFKYFDERVPKEIWYDNLKTAVIERMGSVVRFNAQFLSYLGHHAIRPHACNVARGNEKGRVEDGVRYVRTSFWPGRQFKDFEDLNSQARHWLDNIANQREHRSTRKVPRLHFAAEEASKMRHMNEVAYDTDEIFSVTVPSDYHITYQTNKYSVPWTLTGLAVTVRVNDQELKVFYDQQFVTKHERSYLKHKEFKKSEHEKGLLERKPGASNTDWRVAAVKNIGPMMRDYVEIIRHGQRSIKQELSRVLALSTVYGDHNVYTAAMECIKNGIVGVDNLELLLKSKHHPQKTQLNPQPMSFQKERLNRVIQAPDLRDYDAYLFESYDHKPNGGENETDKISGPGGDTD